MWVNDISLFNCIVLQHVNKNCETGLSVLWKSNYVAFLIEVFQPDDDLFKVETRYIKQYIYLVVSTFYLHNYQRSHLTQKLFHT